MTPSKKTADDFRKAAQTGPATSEPASGPTTDTPRATGTQSTVDKITEAAEGLGDSVRSAAASASDALGDAASAASQAAGDAGARIGEVAGETYDAARDRVASAYRSSREAARSGLRQARARGRSAGRDVEEFFDENPLMIGVFGFVGGLVLGSLLPRTRTEDRQFGPIRDDIARQGIRRGREFVRDAHDLAEDEMVRFRRSVEPDRDYGNRPGSYSEHY